MVLFCARTAEGDGLVHLRPFVEALLGQQELLPEVERGLRVARPRVLQLDSEGTLTAQADERFHTEKYTNDRTV